MRFIQWNLHCFDLHGSQNHPFLPSKNTTSGNRMYDDTIALHCMHTYPYCKHASSNISRQCRPHSSHSDFLTSPSAPQLPTGCFRPGAFLVHRAFLCHLICPMTSPDLQKSAPRASGPDEEAPIALVLRLLLTSTTQHRCPFVRIVGQCSTLQTSFHHSLM